MSNKEIKPYRQDGQRMPYKCPQIEVLKLETLVRGAGSKKPDGLGQPAGIV